MNNKEKNLLYLTRTMNLGGTENVILQLCEIVEPQVDKIVVCSCGGVNVEKLHAMGIVHYEIPDMENKSPKTIFTIMRCVNRIIKKEKINLIHTHHRMATFYAQILQLKNNFKLTSTLHGIFYDKKFLTSCIYSGFPIIACGEIVKKNFVEYYGIDPHKITVICNSVKKDNCPINIVPEISKIQKGIKKIGYIGRLSEEKGVYLLAKTIVKVLRKNENIHFIFVGSGSSDVEERLNEIIKYYNIENHISFLGYRTDVQNIIKQLDIVVLPSYTEGLPLTPIEAFAQARPVVATAVGGTIEIVKDGENGILVTAGDSDALANGIIQICNDKELYKLMSNNALNTYKKRFSFFVFQQKILDYYNKLENEE